MPKKKSTRSDPPRLSDALVMAVCLAGALSCLVFFQLDLNRTLSRLGEQPVGTITWKYRAAQRRFIDRVLWDRLQTESPVYHGDSIRTAALSEAAVTFPGGGIIDLGENSFIRIFVKDALPRLDLLEGNVSVAAGEGGFVLASGAHALTLGPGGAAAAIAQAGGGAEFHVTGGGASLESAGLIRQVSAGEALSLRPDGSAGPEPRTVALAPAPNARLFSSDPSALGVGFEWNGVNYGPGEGTRVELAFDRGFTRLAAVLDVPGGESRAAAELPPGAYFWRAYPRSAGEASFPPAQAYRLTVVYAPPPGAVSPEEGQRFPYRPGGRPPRFRWTGGGAPEPDYYLLEAADNPEMENPLVRFQTRGASAESPLLGPGRWFWRVSARYGDNSRSSPVASFIIEQNAPLSAPALVSPPAEGAVNVSGEGDVYFSWRREAGADSYTLLVSAREDLSDPLISRRVRENYYAHPAAGLGEGRYYWGVSAHDAGGNASPVSSVRPFTAAAARALVRTVFPPDTYIVAEDLLPNLRFTWKTNVSSAHRFQIASDAGFSAPFLDEPAPGETFQARRLPAGTWYWRVAAVSGGQSLYSPANRLTVIEVLPPPELGAPEGSFSGLVDQRQVVVVQPGRRMTFSWRAVTGADRYAFRLYDADEAGGMGERVFEDTVPEGTSLSLSMDNYAEGLYYWTVQPMADEGAAHSRLTGYTGTAQFNLQKTRALTLDYPPPGHEYAGFDALRQPGELRWSSIDTPRRARFILSRSRNLSGRPLMDVSDPGRTIPLVSLSEGTYYWTVRAEGSDGADISPRAPSWFRVLPMPSLEGIRNFQPADNFVFGPEQLRGLSSITFSWDEVEGANAYTFALEREDEGSAPVSIAVSGPSPQRAYTLDNLSVLARGRFVWRVEPLYRGPDGSVIRRGAVRAVRFIVDIPAVQRRNIDDMGTLYGQ